MITTTRSCQRCELQQVKRTWSSSSRRTPLSPRPTWGRCSRSSRFARWWGQQSWLNHIDGGKDNANCDGDFTSIYLVDSIVGPILTVMMSLSLVALIFCGPVYCCNSTTVGVEDQCNYDDVNMIIVMRVEIMIMIILEIWFCWCCQKWCRKLWWWSQPGEILLMLSNDDVENDDGDRRPIMMTLPTMMSKMMMIITGQ